MAFSLSSLRRAVRGRRAPSNWPDAIAAAALRRNARGTARLLRQSNKDVASSGPSDPRRVRTRLPSVVIIPRPLFTDDARSVAAEMGFERVLLLDRRHLKAIASSFLPPDTTNMSYRRVVAREPAAMLEYRSFLTRMWRHFDPSGDVRLVLTGNSCYYSEVDLGAALEELGVAFVSLHKENLKSPGHSARWEAVYRDGRAPFLGRAVLVHNREERDLHIRGDVGPAERIEAVGMPRLDGFHAHRRRTAGEVTHGDLLFAGFLPAEALPRLHSFQGQHPGKSSLVGLPLPDPEERDEHLIEACFAFHRVAVEVARRLPERRVVLKTKGRDRDPKWFPLIVEHVAGPDGPPPNLVIVHGGDAAAMTRAAAMVVGLNTTMLLEAIAAGRPAVVLALGEAAGVMRDHVLDLRGAATVLEDEVEAVERIVQLAATPQVVLAELPDEISEVLERLTGNADGRAMERTIAALRRNMLGTASRSGSSGLIT